MKDFPEKALMTPGEFAEWAGINVQTVYRMKTKGQIPIFQFSLRLYFINVKKFIEQGGPITE